MNILAIIIVLVIVLLIWNSCSVRKAAHFENLRLKEDWGKVSERKYTGDEFENIKKYFQNQSVKDGLSHIDDQTFNDLEVPLLFKKFNKSHTSIGDEFFCYFLRTPDLKGEKTEDFILKCNDLQERAEARFRSEVVLSHFARKKNFSYSEAAERIGDIRKSSPFPEIVSIALLLLGAVSFLVNTRAGLIALIAIMVLNIILYLRKKAYVGNDFDLIEAAMRLLTLSGKVSFSLPDTAGFSDLKTSFHTCLEKSEAVSRYGKLLTYNSRDYGFAGILIDYLFMITHIDLLVYAHLSSIISENKDVFTELFSDIGYVETILSVLSLREYMNDHGGFCFAEWSDTEDVPVFEAADLRNPLLQDPVANSLKKDKSVLITGSNASGKSTFLRTLGLNQLLAETCGFAFADSFRSVHYRICSSMNIRDNLVGGESYFMAESRILKKIMDAANERMPVMAILDEVLRGTNTIERIAASSGILYDLAEQGVFVIAATHDIELTDLLHEKFDNYHFEEQLSGEDISFSYKLKNGKAETRNAILLLNSMGYKKEVIENAEKMADAFTENKEWRMIR